MMAGKKVLGSKVSCRLEKDDRVVDSGVQYKRSVIAEDL